MGIRIILVLLLSVSSLTSWGADKSREPRLYGKLDSKILAACAGKVVILNEKGVVIWKHRAGNVIDVWMLPNGNVLYADGNIHEVTPDHKEVFTYRPKLQKGGASYSCQRLPNGNTLVSENIAGRIVEVDPKGKVVFSFMTTFNPRLYAHRRLRSVRKLENGNYLVVHAQEKKIREYTKEGKIVWELPTNGWGVFAFRLPNGNTMVGSSREVSEFTPDKKKVWTFKEKDIPGVVLYNLCGIQVLPNGNLVIGCYFPKGDNIGTDCLEITRDKKCVWRIINPDVRSMTSVIKLDPSIKKLYR